MDMTWFEKGGCMIACERFHMMIMFFSDTLRYSSFFSPPRMIRLS